LIELLKSGKKIALVSDAGTPLISDPGNIIIKELIKNNIEYTALSGASAITTFMSSVPTEIPEFKFIGFIPRGEKQIEEVVKQNTNTNLVFYESPQRIIKTLEIIKSVRNNVRVALGRELTKLFEEVFIDDISRTIEHFKNDIKGEIVCMLYADKNADTQNIEYKITELKSKGFKDKEISIILSTLFDYNKNEIYKKCLKL
jgi:16S rRNA (cytidine1402-2'-O)-methyltransferase